MFKKALPVFPCGMEKEMNRMIGFVTHLAPDPDALLRCTGSAVYQIMINGSLVFYGPARCCHDWFRVDELPIGSYLTEKDNVLTIRVLSPHCYSYYLLEQDGFLQAEVESKNGVITAYTAPDGDFTAYHIEGHLQKVPRFSFQRTFNEVYTLTPERAAFDGAPEQSGYPVLPLAAQEPKKLTTRNLYVPTFEKENAVSVMTEGSVVCGEKQPMPGYRHYQPSPVYHCFPVDELEANPIVDTLALIQTPDEKTDVRDASVITLGKNRFALLDMGHEMTGFIALDVEAKSDVILTITFDEVLRDGRIDMLRSSCGDVVEYRLTKGSYHLLTADPYSFRYLEIILQNGDAVITAPGLRRVGYPALDVKLNSDSEEEQKVFAAAIETFRQNTFDIYMDCPSRERAGWLCDSFFTSRVEYALTGKTLVENNFLENFLLPETLKFIPKGMLPECFPSDHPNGSFIPNWAMWYVLELNEYKTRRHGNPALIEKARERILALCDYFAKLENSDGLLEKLPGWVFVEWSMANQLVQDVNYPSNALYARMLDVVADLYDVPAYHAKAEKIRDYIRSHAKIGMFYCDNSVRGEDGTLALSGECTEVCQYYMFYFGVADETRDPELWNTILTEFGPDRQKLGLHPSIHPANAFIGNYLRLDTLYQKGLTDQLLRETAGYFLYMADTTGTLWEHTGDQASCNHGFASHVAVWLLGIRGRK